MTLPLRGHAIVDHDHAITLKAPELRPGDRVEIIVLVEQGAQAEKKGDRSFLDTIAGIEIDASPDYSTTFEANLYGHHKPERWVSHVFEPAGGDVYDQIVLELSQYRRTHPE